MSQVRARDSIQVLAPAKVNLCLHVTGQRADGYHLLDSLVAFAAGGDRLRLTPAPELSLTVSGPFAAGVPCDARNLVWRAAELAGWTGAIQLEKNLPHGAGIGGGSSDAAALLRAVGYTGSGLELGADIPVCQLSRAARVSGIGDVVEALPNGLAQTHVLLVNPGVHVSTPAVFRALAQKQNPPLAPFSALEADAPCWLEWLRAQRNDLEAPAIETAPVIAQVLRAIQAREGCDLARMSGSGATCFGIFQSAAARDAAGSSLRRAYPDWWCCATALS